MTIIINKLEITKKQEALESFTSESAIEIAKENPEFEECRNRAVAKLTSDLENLNAGNIKVHGGRWIKVQSWHNNRWGGYYEGTGVDIETGEVWECKNGNGWTNI